MSSETIENENKPCRTCMDFKSWMKLQSEKQTEKKDAGGFKMNFNYGEDEYSHRRKPKKTKNIINEEPTLTGMAAKYGCPVDSLVLGRSTWSFLHTMASYFPDKPNTDEKTDMTNFIKLFSKLYPCPPCASDFREWIKENPPNVTSRSSLGQWFCNAHNDVNKKLGKEEFDCKLYDQRWLDGWKDGSCG